MIGQSFAPLGDQNDLTRPQNQPGSNPVQEAIKVLTLRMPRVLGGGAPAAPELLNSLGGAAVQNPIAALLQQLFAQQPQMGGGMAMGGGPMAPSAPPAPPQSPSSLKPKLEFIPNDDSAPAANTEIKPPLPMGAGRRVFSQ
jgi:hypothetical protein